MTPEPPQIVIRPATKSDEVALGLLGAALMRQHHVFDSRRFLLADRPEAGYGRFLVSQLAEPDCLVVVAEHSGELVGYAFAEILGTSWKDLRGPCGVLHDIYLHENARGYGTGRALLRAAIDWVWSRGRTQVVLSSKSNNDVAQRLFAEFGFRATMTEMTLDRD